MTNEDFVFIDTVTNEPWRVIKISNGDFWLHYWHRAKTWVTLKQITKEKAHSYYTDLKFYRISEDMEKEYEGGVPFKQ